MFKFGPSWGNGYAWDYKGKTEIAQIIVSRSETRINSINVLFVEDGGNKLVMARNIDGDSTHSLNTIMLDYPHEVITGISGKYGTDLNVHGSKRLRCITFVTNKGKYGPLEVSSAKYKREIEFEYDVGCKQFGGFFGTFTSDGIETIGMYLKPLEKLTIHPVKKE
ncbi:jacalin-related lectin 2-like [Apium graveolens]|uniref:jacalin-related lectin 2-like n=1 Tax=Apium graveolens TaxID=4045 RepID=UPI003D7996E5